MKGPSLLGTLSVLFLFGCQSLPPEETSTETIFYVSQSARSSIDQIFQYPTSQGKPLYFRVSSAGVPITVSIYSTYPEELELQQKTGNQISGSITTDYSGMVKFKLTAAAPGESSGSLELTSAPPPSSLP